MSLFAALTMMDIVATSAAVAKAKLTMGSPKRAMLPGNCVHKKGGETGEWRKQFFEKCYKISIVYYAITIFTNSGR